MHTQNALQVGEKNFFQNDLKNGVKNYCTSERVRKIQKKRYLFKTQSPL